MSTAWITLVVAALFEILFALGSSRSDGFTRLWPTVVTAIGAVGGIYCLSLALTQIDVGIGYTVWTGIGAVGTVLISVAFFGERLSLSRGLAILVILAGVVSLHLQA